MITAFEQGRLFSQRHYCRTYLKCLYSSIINQVVYGGVSTIHKLGYSFKAPISCDDISKLPNLEVLDVVSSVKILGFGRLIVKKSLLQYSAYSPSELMKIVINDINDELAKKDSLIRIKCKQRLFSFEVYAEIKM